MHFYFEKVDSAWTLSLINDQNEKITTILFNDTVATEEIISAALLLGKGDISRCSVDFSGVNKDD